MKKKINVLMCCSALSVQGGMVSVLKNYLTYEHWDEFHIIYVPTHVEKNKLTVALYFAVAYVKILIGAIAGKYDIVHLHTAERGSFFRKAILARTLRHFGIKTVMHHHAAEFEEFYASLSDRRKKFVRRTLEMVDLNIVLSDRLVSMITDKAPTARVKVLYNAVVTYQHNPYCADGRGVLFLGRLGKRKGIYDLLKAVKERLDDLPQDVKFYLCGDGETEQVKEKIQELDLTDRIAHLGWIGREEKEQIYKQVMISVLPSYNEGLPMSVLETMAYGIPNISTRIASIPEVIEDGETGCLITPGDIKALGNCLVELTNNAEKRKIFSERSYRLIMDRFSLDGSIGRLKDFYREIMKQEPNHEN